MFVVLVLVEATCLTWIELDTESELVRAVHVHALAENLRMNDEGDVLPLEPDEQRFVTDQMKRHARSIAQSARLPERFRFMR